MALLLVLLLYWLWWTDQPANWPVEPSYYKSGKAPRAPGKWVPDNL